MEFEILSHSYENTGGGTMVGFDRVWIEDEKKVIFVQTNEMGCSFWHVDAYHWCLDDAEPFLFLCTDTDNPASSAYGEIARECMALFVRDDGTSLPWCWLSDGLREKVPAEYRNWFYENKPDECFEIKKGKVIFDDAYELQPNRIAQAAYHLRYVNLIGSLHNFMDAYLRLCAEWSQSSEFDDLLSEEYPFHVSFDELEIPDWVNNSVFKIMENMIEKIEGTKEEM